MLLLGLVELPGWLVGILFFVFSVCVYTWYKQNFFNRMGIRTKDTVFLIGDMYDMKKSKTGFNYIDYDMVKKYGNIFGCFLGNCPSLVISDADIIKEITVKEFSKFTDRVNLLKLSDRWLSAVSIADGEHWRFLRNTLSPTFTAGRMKTMCPYIHKCMDTLHGLLRAKIKESPEGFDITPFIRGYTMDVICSTGFGLEVSAQTNPDNPFIKHSREFLEFDGFKNPMFLLNLFFPDLGWLIPKTSFVSNESMDFFNEATKRAFKERKDENSTHRDLLQLMINAHKGENIEEFKDSEDKLSVEERKQRGLTDDEVLINSVIFMVAGYDTTASTIAWLVYDLVTQPDIQDKLVEEIDRELGQDIPSYENIFKLPYLDMVVSETLRFHPLVSRLNRQAAEDVEIKGLKIKKGMDCTFVPRALHFMPEYWDEPNKYIPERFSPENKANINEYAYLPFGQGPRNCIGKRLALLEVKSTIATLLQNYKIYKTDDLANPMPIAENGLARPGKPVTVKLEIRKRD